MKPIVLVGAGGHGREVAEIVLDAQAREGGPSLAGFLDEDPDKVGLTLLGRPVLGDKRWAWERLDEYDFIITIGDNSVRRRFAEEFQARGATFGRAVSPSAQLSAHSRVGEGTMIFPQVVVSLNVDVGAHVILGVSSNVSHDGVIGDYSFLCPGARTTGNVTLGTEVMLGTNACVIPGMSIGDRTNVGAGAVVAADLGSDLTAVGVPARPVR